MAAGKRQAQKEATQAKLLGVARDLFLAQGFEAVGVREVAQAAGMSTGAIFANFTGKAGLYEAATGKIPPDVAGFLDKLLNCDGYDTVGQLQNEAEALKVALYGLPCG